MALPDSLRAWRASAGKAALRNALDALGTPAALAARDLLVDLAQIAPLDPQATRSMVAALRRERLAQTAEEGRAKAVADLLEVARDVPDWAERAASFRLAQATARAEGEKHIATIALLRGLIEQD